jgi:hypothetical protein
MRRQKGAQAFQRVRGAGHAIEGILGRGRQLFELPLAQLFNLRALRVSKGL